MQLYNCIVRPPPTKSRETKLRLKPTKCCPSFSVFVLILKPAAASGAPRPGGGWQSDILDAFLHPSWVTFILPPDEITSVLQLQLRAIDFSSIQLKTGDHNNVNKAGLAGGCDWSTTVLVWLNRFRNQKKWGRLLQIGIFWHMFEYSSVRTDRLRATTDFDGFFQQFPFHGTNVKKKIPSENHSHELLGWLTYLGESSCQILLISQ